MPVSSQDNDSQCSYGEGSAASSLPPHLHGGPKLPRETQIRGKTWALRGEITINMLHNDSTHVMEEDEDTRDIILGFARALALQRELQRQETPLSPPLQRDLR